MLEKRIQGIREAAAYDPDKMEAPRDLWPIHRADDLEAWLTQRREDGRREIHLDHTS